ncbi:MAG: hypothetical protein LLG02_16655 [Pelosinus sp.]|nr:hypothetical protein [Pelosinus sp.]
MSDELVYVIANDITTMILSMSIDLSADHFSILSQKVDFLNAFPKIIMVITAC